ncbi:MAG: RNA polymerase sigma factor [Hyphomonadaceae bacterium]
MTAGGPDDDAGLVARALAGEERAFTALMRAHKDRLYRFIRAYVRDADEAFDLIQETFVAAWLALERYDPKRPMDVWLRRIALNKCRDWTRRRAVRSFFFGARSLEGNPVDIAAHLTGNDGEEAKFAALEGAIATLPTALKEALLLTALDGRSHKEAAVILGVTAKAIELRVYRARTQLAQVLGTALSDAEG